MKPLLIVCCFVFTLFSSFAQSGFKYENTPEGRCILKELNGKSYEMVYDSIKNNAPGRFAAFHSGYVTIYENAWDQWQPVTIELEQYKQIREFYNGGVGNLAALYSKNGMWGIHYIHRHSIIPPAFSQYVWDNKTENYLLKYKDDWYDVISPEPNLVKLKSACGYCGGSGKITGETRTVEIPGEWVPPTTKTVKSFEYQTLPNGEKSNFLTTPTTTEETVPGYYKPSTFKKEKAPDTECPKCHGEKIFTAIYKWDGRQLVEVK